MKNIPFEEIDEGAAEYQIGKIGTEATCRLFAKHFTLFTDFSDFWKPRLEVAKKCHNYMRRDIFDPGQRKKYMNIDDKWPIEPQEMKPVINTLVGEITGRIRSGTVTTEDDTCPDNAASPEAVSVVLKYLENKMGLKYRRERALHDGLIDGYPQWVWFDKEVSPIGAADTYEAHLEPWSAMLCSKFFQEPDGSDITETFRIRKMTKAELLSRYHGRKKALEDFNDIMKNDPGRLLDTMDIGGGGASNDSETRKNFLFDALVSANVGDDTGMYTAVEHVFSLNKKRDVYIADDLDPVVLPPDWDPELVSSWEQQHPEFKRTHTDIVSTLWSTVFTTNGFIWDNGQHWFQKMHDKKPYAKLPGVPFIASMEDNIPTGAGEDMLPYVLLIAACATEGLHQVRVGTGRTTFIEEGFIRHPKYLQKELSAAEGVVILKKGGVSGGAVKTEMRKPNETYFNLEDRYRQQLTLVHNINESMRGAFAPRQSSVAKEKEIMQGMSTQSEYINNYMHFTLNLTQLVCDMIPFLIKENELIQIDDEFGNKKSVEVNKEDYDWEGKAVNVLNDLNATRYRIVPAIGDDSPTSREQDLKNFVQIMEASGNSIFKLIEISPRMVAGFLASWQNRYAKETAKFLLEHADAVEQQQQQQGQSELQAQQEKTQMKYETDMAKIRSPIVNYKISPTDIQEAPFGFQIMMAMAEKLRNGEAASNPQGGVTVPRESPPAASPEGELPPEIAMQQQMMSAGAQQPVAQ